MKKIKNVKRNPQYYIPFLLLILGVTSISYARELTVRNAHSMAYDTSDQRTLLFGGADEKRIYGDLWVLKKNGWKLLESKGPEPRTFASLVYDEANSRLILFGGNKVLFGSDSNPAKMFNDLWEYKNRKWRRLNPSNSPEPRAEAAIAYDKAKKRIILFGGYKIENGKIVKLGDTWEFKNGNWNKLGGNGPSPRNGAAISYDSSVKRVFLFGGSTVNRDYGAGTGETWVLEKNRWKKLKIIQPENVFNSNIVDQQGNLRLFRFGGWNGKGRTNETWMFRQNSWTKLNLKTNPSARNHAAMVYDSKSGRTILFGGHDGEKIFGDLWIFESGKWYKQFEHTPIKKLDNGH